MQRVCRVSFCWATAFTMSLPQFAVEIARPNCATLRQHSYQLAYWKTKFYLYKTKTYCKLSVMLNSIAFLFIPVITGLRNVFTAVKSNIFCRESIFNYLYFYSAVHVGNKIKNGLFQYEVSPHKKKNQYTLNGYNLD